MICPPFFWLMIKSWCSRSWHQQTHVFFSVCKQQDINFFGMRYASSRTSAGHQYANLMHMFFLDQSMHSFSEAKWCFSFFFMYIASASCSIYGCFLLQLLMLCSWFLTIRKADMMVPLRIQLQHACSGQICSYNNRFTAGGYNLET